MTIIREICLLRKWVLYSNIQRNNENLKDKEMTQEKIDKINELYHKSKTPEGLTAEELELQKKLRAEYIADIKASIRGQLNNIDIIEKDGTVVNVGEEHDKRKA